MDRIVDNDKRCLITGETGPPEAMKIAHVLSKDTSDEIRAKLQHTWGGNFRTNDPCNLFYLRHDLHNSFDHDGWALVPAPKLVKKILRKVVAEQSRRRKNNDNSVWPDHRSNDWFPCDEQTRYRYIFVPLLLKDQRVTIARHVCLTPTCSEIPPNVSLYSPPAYTDFPILESHIDP